MPCVDKNKAAYFADGLRFGFHAPPEMFTPGLATGVFILLSRGHS